ncbi:hypothetical protein L1987_49931 [Smallanthus sonchifolius]|uniref:Uncharacterized protein n=1 Tax=Smallanthus sonchifolius TaxID=185202 RepID=A0ACB9FVV3_9ASTR|nr:hypothetical protein L1987_49931 [Smallanthus sonchifolius]
MQEWRCAVCDISASCERGPVDHLAGKKHLAKVESLKGNNGRGDIGLGIIKNYVKKQTSRVKSMKGNNIEEIEMISEGGRMRKKFKFWCKMCQTGAHDEKVMIDHRKGKKHIKNRHKKAHAWRFSNRK